MKQEFSSNTQKATHIGRSDEYLILVWLSWHVTRKDPIGDVHKSIRIEIRIKIFCQFYQPMTMKMTYHVSRAYASFDTGSHDSSLCYDEQFLFLFTFIQRKF